MRALNAELHRARPPTATGRHPRGAHAIAAGLGTPISVDVRGHAGYYCARDEPARPTITVNGNAGVGVAENMMSGLVRVHGDASQSAGPPRTAACWSSTATPSMRCGDLDEGRGHRRRRQRRADERVHGAGRPARGLRRRGRGARRLDLRGADLRPRHRRLAGCGLRREGDARRAPAELGRCSPRPASSDDPAEFTRYGSARRLYHFTRGQRPTDRRTVGDWPARVRDLRPATIADIQRAAATGVYDIRGWGAKRRRPALRRPAVPRRVAVALPAGGLPRALRHRRRARRPARQAAAAPRHPDHDRRDELRRAVGPGEGGPRARGAARSAPPPRPATAA